MGYQERPVPTDLHWTWERHQCCLCESRCVYATVLAVEVDYSSLHLPFSVMVSVGTQCHVWNDCLCLALKHMFWSALKCSYGKIVVPLLQFFPNGQAFATGSDDATCRLFDIRADQVRSFTPINAHFISRVCNTIFPKMTYGDFDISWNPIYKRFTSRHTWQCVLNIPQSASVTWVTFFHFLTV